MYSQFSCNMYISACQDFRPVSVSYDLEVMARRNSSLVHSICYFKLPKALQFLYNYSIFTSIIRRHLACSLQPFFCILYMYNVRIVLAMYNVRIVLAMYYSVMHNVLDYQGHNSGGSLSAREPHQIVRLQCGHSAQVMCWHACTCNVHCTL